MAHFTFLRAGLGKITPPHLTNWLLAFCAMIVFAQTIKAQNGASCNDAILLNNCNTNIAISNYETWLSFTALDSIYQLTFPAPTDTPRAHIVSIEIYQGYVEP